ncbi:MAG: hypothetical protein GY795_24610 [Desulfobacterales bacterium]|nr:hypothetical protein [Desulfobacterales bacterium]
MTDTTDTDAAAAAPDLPSAEKLHLPAVQGPPTASEWAAIRSQSDYLSAGRTTLPPVYHGKPADLALVMLTGRELQVGPVTAISQIHVIEGKPSLSANLMIALIRRAGHFIRFTESTEHHATLHYRRLDWPADEYGDHSWTIEDAKTAKLVGGRKPKDNWTNYPKAMLRARCISDVARMEFSDVLLGATYTPEELGADVDADTGEPIKVGAYKTAEGAVCTELAQRGNDLEHDERNAFGIWLREEALVIRERDGTPLLPESEVERVRAKLAELEQAADLGASEPAEKTPPPETKDEDTKPAETEADASAVGADTDVAEGEVVGETDGKEAGEASESEEIPEADVVGEGKGDSAGPQSGSGPEPSPTAEVEPTADDEATTSRIIGDHTLRPRQTTDGKHVQWNCAGKEDQECLFAAPDVELDDDLLEHVPPPACPTGDPDAASEWLDAMKGYAVERAKGDAERQAAADDDEHEQAIDEVKDKLDGKVVQEKPPRRTARKRERPKPPEGEKPGPSRSQMQRVAISSNKVKEVLGWTDGQIREAIGGWLDRPVKSRKELYPSEVPVVLNVLRELAAEDIGYEGGVFVGVSDKGGQFLSDVGHGDGS